MGHLDSATALDAVPQAYLDDGDVQLYHGDVIQTLRSLPSGIAQTCVTSPPYWGLRDYGTGEWTGGDEDCDHVRVETREPERAGGRVNRGTDRPRVTALAYTEACGRCGARRVDSQLGLEATPTLYVERLVAVFREVWRVLRDDGTVWLNLGDSYVGGGRGGHSEGINGSPPQGKGNAYPKPAIRCGCVPADCDWPVCLKPKDLVGIPWRVAFALQADGWYLRSDIVWSKPNPMPESVTDTPTKAHEYLFLLSKRPRYFYDADAIREAHSDNSHERRRDGSLTPKQAEYHAHPNNGGQGGLGPHVPNPAGRNRRSVWTIPTEPFPEAHFATYPQALVRPCIQAGTSEHGECSSCGAPWVREVERKYRSAIITTGIEDGRYEQGRNRNVTRMGDGVDVETTGWRASCTCDAATRPQTVIDPFIGSGTTALVARNHNRRCIGIDLSAEYLSIAAKRLQQLSLLGGTT